MGQLTQTPDGQGFMRAGAAQVAFDQVAVWLTLLNHFDPATAAILSGDSSAPRVAAGVKTSSPTAQVPVQGVLPNTHSPKLLSRVDCTCSVLYVQ